MLLRGNFRVADCIVFATHLVFLQLSHVEVIQTECNRRDLTSVTRQPCPGAFLSFLIILFAADVKPLQTGVDGSGMLCGLEEQSQIDAGFDGGVQFNARCK